VTSVLFCLAVAAAAVAGLLLPSAVTVTRLPRPAEVARTHGPDAPEGLLRYRLPMALAAGGGVALLLGGWIGVALGVGALVGVWRFAGRLEPPSVRRRREALTAQLPMTVDLLATCLAVGTAPTAAVDQVVDAVAAPMSEELRVVSGKLRLGVDPHQVWADVSRHRQLAPLGRCLARALDSGASVSESMGRLADDLRRTARSDVESRARSVGVRAAVPLGVCLLPAFILIGIVPLVAGAVQVFVRP